MTEFEIIARYFSSLTAERDDVILGVGDDAAIVQTPPDKEQIIALDTMVSGVHFPVDTPPHAIGHKILAVNLSDLAAMGAEPAWFTLSVSLPGEQDSWLEEFASGMKAIANEYQVALIGGDTVRAPVLSLTVQVAGYCERGRALRRSGARAGDIVYVSGVLGDAGMGLLVAKGAADVAPEAAAYFLKALNYPQPRIALGRRLSGMAHAAIDISDGLLADLGHILEQSRVGAHIDAEKVPLSSHYKTAMKGRTDDMLALTAGDDFEICFTAPPALQEQVMEVGESLGLPITAIGVIASEPGLRVIDANGEQLAVTSQGYDHFGSS